MHKTNILCNTIKSIAALTGSAEINHSKILQSKKISDLFNDLKEFSIPSENLLNAFLLLAFDKNFNTLKIPCVIKELMLWLPDFNEREQSYVSGLLFEKLTKSYEL